MFRLQPKLSPIGGDFYFQLPLEGERILAKVRTYIGDGENFPKPSNEPQKMQAEHDATTEPSADKGVQGLPEYNAAEPEIERIDTDDLLDSISDLTPTTTATSNALASASDALLEQIEDEPLAEHRDDALAESSRLDESIDDADAELKKLASDPLELGSGLSSAELFDDDSGDAGLETLALETNEETQRIAEEKAREDEEEKRRRQEETNRRAAAEASRRKDAVKRKAEEEAAERELQIRQRAEQKAALREAEIKRKAEEEARRREEEIKRKAEEEARRREEEIKRKAEEEARRREEEIKRKAEEEARRREEEIKRKAEEEARRREEEIKRKAEEEARRREEEIKRKAEEEARRREEEIKRKAEEEARRREEEIKRKAEEEARRREEELQRKAEETRKLREEEITRRAKETSQRREEAIKRKAKEVALRREEELKRKAKEKVLQREVEIRRQAEESVREREEELQRKAEQAAREREEEFQREFEEAARRREELRPGRVEELPVAEEGGDEPLSAPDHPKSRFPLGVPPVGPEAPETSEGNVGTTTDVATLFFRFWEQKVTGRIDFSWDDRLKSVFFERGFPVDAYSSDAFDRMEEYLYREGKITRGQYQAARVKGIQNRRRLGAYLVSDGFLKPDELFIGVRGHLEDIILSLFEWETGSYRFIPEMATEDDRIALGVHPLALFLSGIRRKYLLRRLIRIVGGPSTLIKLKPSAEQLLEHFDLSPEERQALRFLDGTRSIEDLVFSTGQREHGLYSILAALVTAGAVEVLVHGLEGMSADGTSDSDSIDKERILEKLQHVRRQDYFQILGLSRGATPYEVDQAFKRSVREFSPQHFSQTLRHAMHDELEEIGQVLTEARMVLRDEPLRDAYARHLPAAG